MVAKTEVPGRQKVFGPVLLCPGFPGLENGFLALWAVFWGAESEFEVRFSKFVRLGFWEFSTFRAFALLSSHSRSSVTYRDGICVRQNLGFHKAGIESFKTAQKSSKSDTI